MKGRRKMRRRRRRRRRRRYKVEEEGDAFCAKERGRLQFLITSSLFILSLSHATANKRS